MNIKKSERLLIGRLLKFKLDSSTQTAGGCRVIQAEKQAQLPSKLFTSAPGFCADQRRASGPILIIQINFYRGFKYGTVAITDLAAQCRFNFAVDITAEFVFQ